MKNIYEEKVIKYWKERKAFKNEDDIYDIPVVSKETYNNIIIPNIIRCGGIPKKDLIIGKTYIGSCRNTSEATWDGKKFIYDRHKWGFVYEEAINHFEDDDEYDLFVPIKMKN